MFLVMNNINQASKILDKINTNLGYPMTLPKGTVLNSYTYIVEIDGIFYINIPELVKFDGERYTKEYVMQGVGVIHNPNKVITDDEFKALLPKGDDQWE